jgi:hypothetical protein
MKQPFSEEILSAYIDDELSAPERAAVERWLDESPEAREKLEDFRNLSGLFAGLPQTEAPPEFSTNVLQLAERRMLLPESRPANSRQTLRRWAVAGGSSIAAALFLGLMLHALLPVGQPPQRAGRFDGLGRPAGGPEVADGSQTALRDGKLQDLAAEVASNKSSPARSPLPVDQPGAGPAAPASAEGILERDSLESAIGRSAGGNARRERSMSAGFVTALAALSPAQQEQINLAMEEIGNTPEDEDVVAVARFLVIDRAEGMDLVQDVLAENQILVETEQAGEEGRSEGRIAAKSAAPVDAGNEAFYIRAEPYRVEAIISKILVREKVALGLEIGDPIEIATLDEVSKQRVQQVDRELISNVAGNKPTVPDDAKKSAEAQPASEPAKPDEKPRQGDSPPAPAEKKSLAKPRAAANVPQRPAVTNQKDDARRFPEMKTPVAEDAEAGQKLASQARQTIVNLPLAESNERRRAGAAGKESLSSRTANRNAPAARGSKKEQALRYKDGDKDELAPALMRVLIVVEESAK